MKRAMHFILKHVSLLTILTTVLVPVTSSQSVEVHAKPLTENDIQLLRQDLQSIKNQVITHTMNFDEKEGAAFWPVYKEYSAAQQSIASKRLAVISDYVRNFDKMDDATARGLADRMFAIEDETQKLRKEYFPRFETVLGAKRAAKFYKWTTVSRR